MTKTTPIPTDQSLTVQHVAWMLGKVESDNLSVCARQSSCTHCPVERVCQL